MSYDYFLFLPLNIFFAFWIFFLPLDYDYFLFCPLIKILFYEYNYYYFFWCKCIIFFLMYSIIFFFPFGCPWVGGCPSPRACWAYPRAGLDNRHKVLLWVSGLEGTRTSNDWGIHPRPDQLNYLLGLHLLSIFDLIF